MERAIFINYRGDDTHSYGALLHNELKGWFGEGLVFLDVESIPAGQTSWRSCSAGCDPPEYCSRSSDPAG